MVMDKLELDTLIRQYFVSEDSSSYRSILCPERSVVHFHLALKLPTFNRKITYYIKREKNGNGRGEKYPWAFPTDLQSVTQSGIRLSSCNFLPRALN